MEPGEAIPPEIELAKTYEVSRGTVSKAIEELVREGLLIRKQGKGTFVCEPKIKQKGTSLLSFTEEIKNHGYSTKAEILSFAKMPADRQVRQKLNLAQKDEVYKIKRIRFIEEEPMALVTSYLPEKLVGNLSKNNIRYSVYGYLEKLGLAPVKAKDKFMARIANPEIANLLNIPEGSAIFQSERIAYTKSFEIIELAEGYIQGRDYMLSIESSVSEKFTGKDGELKAFYNNNYMEV